MPEEPQNTDNQSDAVKPWGETEPSTQASEVFSGPITAAPITPVDDASVALNDDVFVDRESQAEEQSPVVAEPATPVSPTPFMADSPVSPVNAPTVKKSKKPLMIGIILVVLFALLGGGGVLAYSLWYQNPEKVVTDALMNAATAQSSTYVGTITTNTSDAKLAVNVTAKQTGATGSVDASATITTGGKDYTLNGSTLINSSGDLYFKIEKLAAIVNEYKNQLGLSLDASQSSTIDQLVAKIDGTWIKVSNTDLKDFSSTAATAQTCINDAVTKFKDDKAAIAEVLDVYKKNPFIIIDKKLGQKDGSLGYAIKGDATVSNAFANGLKSTKIYTTLHNCDSTFTIDTSSLPTSKDSTSTDSVELWVNSWSHQITKIVANDAASDGSTTAITLSPTYNQAVQITTPTSSTTLSQLKTDISNLLLGL